MDTFTRKTDSKACLILPGDFADCLVRIERVGEELRVRKVPKAMGRRYSFKQLMSGVTKKNMHAAMATDPAVGKEVL